MQKKRWLRLRARGQRWRLGRRQQICSGGGRSKEQEDGHQSRRYKRTMAPAAE
jgi:hypothetical protein